VSREVNRKCPVSREVNRKFHCTTVCQ